jgi:acyl-coenzyme A synthetase/AMP-(fatty) acid ligase
LPSASITEDGFYISNDLFRVDEEGFYYYIGRADDMFTNGGNNIYPRQVELVIESHPMVREAAVVGIEDEIKGAKPYALVTLNGPVTGQAIKDLVLSQLPASHCPKEVWVIENLPLNTVNKIDRKELKAQAELMLKNGVPSI